MASAPYKIGIIGCGSMGRSHAGNWAAREDVRIVATADVSLDAAKALAEPHRAKPYDRYGMMLEAEDLDIVSITTWQRQRHVIVSAAANSGVKAILAEKPMTDSWGGTVDMIEACDRNGVKLAIGHQRRFMPQNIEARRLITSGAIGAPTQAIRRGVDGLLNRGTHALDDMLNWLGDPKPMWLIGQAFRRTDRWERRVRTEDVCACIVCFEGGARGIYEGDCPAPELADMCIYGTDGTIKLPSSGDVLLMNADKSGWQTITPPPSATDQFQELIDWIEGRIERHRNAAEVAVSTMAIMMGLYESVRVQGVVHFPIETRDNPLDILVESGRMPVEKPGRYDIRAPFPEQA